MRHLLGIESLNRKSLEELLQSSFSLLEIGDREVKKVPALRGKTVINLFLEPSTRTRTSFEIAGKRLSADTINISESGSSVKKGETLLDTARTLEAMSPDVIVIRHPESGAPHLLSKFLSKSRVVNAGDGLHEHPTQALLDCLSLMKKFGEEKLSKLKVAIVGDIRHSRVARSNILAHTLLGNKITLVAPPTLIPQEFIESYGKENVNIEHDLKHGIEGADVVICLRVQLERASGNFLPSLDEYSKFYCVNEPLLKQHAPNSVVLHPGPMNRGVEITSEVADGPRSLIRDQVACGVAVRMSVLHHLCVATAP